MIAKERTTVYVSQEKFWEKAANLKQRPNALMFYSISRMDEKNKITLSGDALREELNMSKKQFSEALQKLILENVIENKKLKNIDIYMVNPEIAHNCEEDKEYIKLKAAYAKLHCK
ncbi:hypothetical protein LA345_23280 [Burkholderia vietnamiensis]|nr:hypothetical protein [Burkholderia vietnamiensis]